MRTVLYILSLIIICSSIAKGEALTVIPFTLKSGLIVVEATLDNKNGLYVFDTGASDILIDDKISSGNALFSTIEGEVLSDSYTINNFILGTIERSELTAYKMDLSSVESYLALDLAGIIGGNILENKTIVIDYNNSIIKIYTPSEIQIDKQRKQLSFNIIDGVPVVNIKINNTPYNFILDSGATAHFIDKSLVSSLGPLLTDLNTIVNTTTASNQSESKAYLLEQIMIDNIKIESFQVITGSFSNLLEDVPISGLLSLSKLAKDKLYIDLSKQVIYL